MNFVEMQEAIEDAERTIIRAGVFLSFMARQVEFNLKNPSIDANTLSALKRKLRKWNMVREKWAD